MPAADLLSTGSERPMEEQANLIRVLLLAANHELMLRASLPTPLASVPLDGSLRPQLLSEVQLSAAQAGFVSHARLSTLLPAPIKWSMATMQTAAVTVIPSQDAPRGEQESRSVIQRAASSKKRSTSGGAALPALAADSDLATSIEGTVSLLPPCIIGLLGLGSAKLAPVASDAPAHHPRLVLWAHGTLLDAAIDATSELATPPPPSMSIGPQDLSPTEALKTALQTAQAAPDGWVRAHVPAPVPSPSARDGGDLAYVSALAGLASKRGFPLICLHQLPAPLPDSAVLAAQTVANGTLSPEGSPKSRPAASWYQVTLLNQEAPVDDLGSRPRAWLQRLFGEHAVTITTVASSQHLSFEGDSLRPRHGQGAREKESAKAPSPLPLLLDRPLGVRLLSALAERRGGKCCIVLSGSSSARAEPADAVAGSDGAKGPSRAAKGADAVNEWTKAAVPVNGRTSASAKVSKAGAALTSAPPAHDEEVHLGGVHTLAWELTHAQQAASRSAGGAAPPKKKPRRVQLGRLSVIGNALPLCFGTHGATELFAVASSVTHLEFTSIVDGCTLLPGAEWAAVALKCVGVNCPLPISLPSSLLERADSLSESLQVLTLEPQPQATAALLELLLEARAIKATVKKTPRIAKGSMQLPASRGYTLPLYARQPPLPLGPPLLTREQLGNRLHPLVAALEPMRAPQITGMLLELAQPQVLELIHSAARLHARVTHAGAVLDAHARLTSSPAAAAAAERSMAQPDGFGRDEFDAEDEFVNLEDEQELNLDDGFDDDDDDDDDDAQNDEDGWDDDDGGGSQVEESDGQGSDVGFAKLLRRSVRGSDASSHTSSAECTDADQLMLHGDSSFSDTGGSEAEAEVSPPRRRRTRTAEKESPEPLSRMRRSWGLSYRPGYELPWSELSSSHQAAARHLGFDEPSWNGGLVANAAWEELDAVQRDAARHIGLDALAWTRLYEVTGRSCA